jgi:hypothetical protein
VAEFVENHEAHAGEVVGNPTLAATAGLGLELIDKIDHIIEAATRAGPYAVRAIAVARWVFPVPVPPGR